MCKDIDTIRTIIEFPKKSYYPNQNYEYNKTYTLKKIPRKKHSIGNFKEIKVNNNTQKSCVKIIKTGFWTFYSKSGNIIEFGNFTESGKKFGNWYGYYGGTKNFNDRLKYETNYYNDKIIGIQKFYLKTKNEKSVYLWKEIEYDNNGELTGKMIKYNEQKQIIWKTFIKDDIIIKEKYDSLGNIIVHREYNFEGKSINKWFINKCEPTRNSYIIKFLFEYYKRNFIIKYKDYKVDFDVDFNDYRNHPYYKLKISNDKTVPECISTISFIKIYTPNKIIIEIYDKNKNIICIVEKNKKTYSKDDYVFIENHTNNII